MLFDTDIFIWVQRGNKKALALMEQTEERYLSVQTYLELMQNARNKHQHQTTKDFLKSFSFYVLPFTENIGHRACIYIEEYALATGLRAGDAIVAATASENSLVLATSNAKHFRAIKDLQIKIFRP